MITSWNIAFYSILRDLFNESDATTMTSSSNRLRIHVMAFLIVRKDLIRQLDVSFRFFSAVFQTSIEDMWKGCMLHKGYFGIVW